MIDAVVEPLEFGFMQRAFLAAALAAIVCAVVGTFVVLKGMASGLSGCMVAVAMAHLWTFCFPRR